MLQGERGVGRRSGGESVRTLPSHVGASLQMQLPFKLAVRPSDKLPGILSTALF
jgi:hypothetical protein